MVAEFSVNDARNSRSDFRSDFGFLCAICIVILGFGVENQGECVNGTDRGDSVILVII